MTAQEIINVLHNVAPDTDVTITTDNGTLGIDRVITTGYTGRATIVTAE